MKNALLLFLLPSVIYSQASIITTFEYGNKPLETNELEIALTYEDESPVPDFVTDTFNLKASSSVNYLSIGLLQDNFKEKFLMGIKADLFFKDFFGFNLDLIGGLLIKPSDQFQFGPRLDVTLLGFSNKKIGNLNNNTGYIEVNNTKFYSNQVKLSFQNVWFGLKPSFFAAFAPNKAFNIFGHIGYSINASIVNIGFSGDDVNGDQISAVENIDVDNLTFNVITPDNIENAKKESKIGFNGWYYSLGLGINFNQLNKNK